jgi:integrase
VRDEAISRNVAALMRVPKPRRRKVKPWSVEEARKFLEAARKRRDPLYPAYVLILVLGLRRGEMLGLRWEDVDLDKSELAISWQIQRIRGQLLHRETKTESSDAVLPLVDICETALRDRAKEQQKYAQQPEEAGTNLAWSSPYEQVTRWSRVTSIGAS